MSESSSIIAMENRVINSIRRNYRWVAEDHFWTLLSVMGPQAFLEMPNIGWKMMAFVVDRLNGLGLRNRDFEQALRRHYAGDQVQLSNGVWV